MTYIQIKFQGFTARKSQVHSPISRKTDSKISISTHSIWNCEVIFMEAIGRDRSWKFLPDSNKKLNFTSLFWIEYFLPKTRKSPLCDLREKFGENLMHFFLIFNFIDFWGKEQRDIFGKTLEILKRLENSTRNCFLVKTQKMNLTLSALSSFKCVWQETSLNQ